MSIFCNYNIPIFPMTFGALTMGAGGCSVPMGSMNYCNPFMPDYSAYTCNPFMSSLGMFNYTPPIFNFDNSNTNITNNNSTSNNNSGWTMPWSGWFNNNSLNVPKFNFSNMNFNFSNTPMSSYSSSSVGDTFTRSNNDNLKITSSGGKISIEGYNSSLGTKIADTAYQNRNKTKGWYKGKYTDFTGNCCRYVKTALKNAGVSEYYDGHAYQMVNKFKNNKNFKQISTNVDVKSLPAGCILIYGKGVAGYSDEYGHIEVTLGDGRAVSDGITNNLRQKPTAIYVPV